MSARTYPFSFLESDPGAAHSMTGRSQRSADLRQARTAPSGPHPHDRAQAAAELQPVLSLSGPTMHDGRV